MEEPLAYFGFGSNMLPSILTNKKVSVLNSVPAFLPGVKLKFNLATKSILEPSYGNLQFVTPEAEFKKCVQKIEQLKRDTSKDNFIKLLRTGSRDDLTVGVHGVVHEMNRDQMALMDKLEGNGRAYQRKCFNCFTYDGRELVVFGYICDALSAGENDITLEDKPPSRRYLRVLYHGARHFNLNPTYLQWLRKHPYTPLPKYNVTPEQQQKIESKLITLKELAEEYNWKPEYDSIPDQIPLNDSEKLREHGYKGKVPIVIAGAIKGIVCDVAGMRMPRTYMAMLSGKDCSLFAAGRVAAEEESDSDDEHHDDIAVLQETDSGQPELQQGNGNANGNSNGKQKLDRAFIPTALHELRQEHKDYINGCVMDWIAQCEILGHTEQYGTFGF